MLDKLLMTNESLESLKHSNDFINEVLNNIKNCVLVLDKDMKLIAFNDPLKTIFSNKKDEDLNFLKCGEAIGCAYQIDEQTECGTTSKCDECELRLAAIESYTENKVVYNDKIVKPFLNYMNEKINKHLKVSTRLFVCEWEKYIIMIVEDNTEFMELQEKFNRLISS